MSRFFMVQCVCWQPEGRDLGKPMCLKKYER